MMNHSFLRAAALTLCFAVLCAVAAGCQSRSLPSDVITDPANDSAATTAATTASRPLAQPEDATGSVFLGSWNVSAQTSQVSSATFSENGTVVIVLNGNKLSGTFYVESDTDMTMLISDKEMKTTYVVDGDTITLTTDNDVWIMTKP